MPRISVIIWNVEKSNNGLRNEHIMIIKNGLLFCEDGEFRNFDIKSQDGIISEIGESLSTGDCVQIIDATDCYVIPGLVDIHTHGAVGADFCDGTKESVKKISKYLFENGVTSYLATTMSLPEDNLTKICKVLKDYVDNPTDGCAVMRGIHLEGPFFNQSKRGAQNAEYIINPDFDMFDALVKASDDTVKLISVAPELIGGLDFINYASLQCKVSLGHSSADYETACSAYLGGATQATHLFNGMNTFIHREPGIIGAAFDCGAYVELISDGVHIHPSVVRAVFKLFGDDKVCLISDSMRACGLGSGSYDLGGQTVTVEGKASKTTDGSLAGSVSTLLDCLRYAVKIGIPLNSALKATTLNPAKSVSIDKQIGSLSLGKRADIVILDKELNVKQVLSMLT